MREPAYLSGRSVAATLPIAALAGSPAAALRSSAAIRHPDAELFELVASYEAAEARRDDADRQVDEAFDRLVSPAVPKALIWRKSDWPGISSDHPITRLAQYRIDGRWEYVYESLASLPTRWTGPQPPPLVYGKPRQKDCERAAEIIAAIGEWHAANKRAEDAAGYPEASVSERAYALVAALEKRILAARAQTTGGVMAKLGVMSGQWPSKPGVARTAAASRACEDGGTRNGDDVRDVARARHDRHGRGCGDRGLSPRLCDNASS